MMDLFETTSINGMNIKNRFIRSATWEGMADNDGSCTSRLNALYTALAEGGCGLIISSHIYVQKAGKASAWQLGIYDDSLIPSLKKLTDNIHEKGGKIIAQLAHAGLYAAAAMTGTTAIAPSAIHGFSSTPPKEMSINEISETVEAFGAAAQRAVSAGFDGIQIHAAHGYLISQFLSPAYNKRTDQYGGTPERRARILVEIINTTRKKVGSDYPVIVKMNSEDYVDGGLENTESVLIAKLISTNGIDALELSGGTISSGKLVPSRSGINSTEKEAYFSKSANLFKKNIDIPLILVGGIRSPKVANATLEDGTADYLSMSRPFIREPDLINRWKSGNGEKAACISCNSCFAPAMKGEGIYCVVAKKLKEKNESP